MLVLVSQWLKAVVRRGGEKTEFLEHDEAI